MNRILLAIYCDKISNDCERLKEIAHVTYHKSYDKKDLLIEKYSHEFTVEELIPYVEALRPKYIIMKGKFITDIE